ncbi:unnamed protein product [Prunus armeniaca]|uniref:Uncharacterized protein n=1 Tax=Prunus armeniaca TaxID=36596 RepID=A0A6J5Y6L1_PRUAR|nr:unnamed protein product [Prunus armeniaca]
MAKQNRNQDNNRRLCSALRSGTFSKAAWIETENLGIEGWASTTMTKRARASGRIPSQTELGVLPSLGSVKSVVPKNAASFSSSPAAEEGGEDKKKPSTHSAFAAPRKLLAPTFPRYKLPKIPKVPKIPNLKFPPLTPTPLWPEYRLPPPIITSLPNFPSTPTFPFSPPSITTTP